MTNKSLESRLILAIIFTVAFVLTCSTLGFLTVLNRNHYRKIRDEIEAGREGVRQAMMERRRRSELIASIVADNPVIRTALSANDSQALYEQLKSLNTLLESDALAIISNDGIVLAHAGRGGAEPDAEKVGEPIFLNPLFRDVWNGKPASGIELCAPDIICVDSYTAIYSSRFSEGKLIGYARAGFMIDDNFAGDVRRTTGTDLIVLRSKIAVASSIPKDSLPREEVEKLSETISEAAAETCEECKENDRLWYLALGGKPYAFGAEPFLDASGWEIARRIIGRNTKDLADIRRQSSMLMAAIALAALTASFLLSIALARRVFLPIRVLLERVKEITAGRMDVRAPVSSNDEIGALSTAFNEMADTLTERERSLKEAAEQLLYNQDQLIQSGKMAAVGELAAGIAHEIGNPLSAVSGYAQMIVTRCESPDKVKEYALEIEKESDFIEKIIRDLLEFSRPSTKDKSYYNISDLIEQAEKTVSAHKAFSKIKTIHKLSPDIPPVLCHGKEIMQVLLNLLMNAAQAMTYPGTITIEAELKPDYIIVRVKDEGPGVSSEIKDKIFNPFFTTKPPGVGTGLGLSICFRIVEKHGGRLYTEDSENGAVFSFTLPVTIDNK